MGACSPILSPSDFSLFPNCSTITATTNCTTLSTVAPLNKTALVCPAPLVKNPDFSVNRTTCPGGVCCIPCPQDDVFYPEGSLRSYFLACNWINFVFSFFAMATVIVYAVMPSKRGFPQNVIFFMSLSLLIVYMFTYVSLFVPPEELLCISPLDIVRTSSPPLPFPSFIFLSFTRSLNLIAFFFLSFFFSKADPELGVLPRACTAQGVFLVYGYLSAIFWFSCVAINLFLVSCTSFREKTSDF